MKSKKNNSDYQERVDNQIAQYSDMTALSGLPDIYRYWTQQYVVPKFKEVFGVKSVIDAYALNYISSGEKSQDQFAKILSIGSGDGIIEIQIAKSMLQKDFNRFSILLTELSPLRLERAKENIRKNQLEQFFEYKVVDVNDWKPEDKFTGVMAQHTLHHIVELEKMFSFVHDVLTDEGVFFIVDMIGRNGHMRWPETLEILEQFWTVLPDQYKFNHQWNKQIDKYINWDCSHKGFEGIRSQDILPLLCENFSFSHFLGVGGFVDIYVDRGFGHNFKREIPVDKAYIDLMAAMNDALLVEGSIKPTMIFAICQKKSHQLSTRCYRGMTPDAAIRIPD